MEGKGTAPTAIECVVTAAVVDVVDEDVVVGASLEPVVDPDVVVAAAAVPIVQALRPTRIDDSNISYYVYVMELQHTGVDGASDPGSELRTKPRRDRKERGDGTVVSSSGRKGGRLAVTKERKMRRKASG